MLELLTIFVVGFASVFALGFQSRNVNNGDYKWAAATSFVVGLSQAGLWNKITAPDAGTLSAIVYGLSGASAITTSMYVHKRFIENGNRQASSSCEEKPHSKGGMDTEI